MRQTMGLGCCVFLLAISARASEPDPCDFTSGSEFFSYEQVMSCFRRVPFRAADRDNIVQVIEQQRSFSDLAEIYEARAHWREALARVAQTEFANDLALQDALVDEHKNFRNGHVSYSRPECYLASHLAFIPFDFGSTLANVQRDGAVASRREQIIFVEDVPLGPALYLEATGIDTSPFVGQRIVSINDVPVLDYFRSYARRQRTHEDDGGALNGILQDLDYSLRSGDGYYFFPEQAADTYVFESADGTRQQLTLPWVFVSLAPIVDDDVTLLPTASTDEFVTWCTTGQRPFEPLADAELRLLRRALPTREDLFAERKRMLRRLGDVEFLAPAPARSTRPGNTFSEVPPERVGQDIEQIIPLTGSADVLQFAGDVTVLRLRDTVGWVDVAREGIEYACQNSERLIVDLRSNGGGNDTVIRFLHNYLFPEQGPFVQGGLLPLRVRNDNPALNEFLFNMAAFDLAFPPLLGECGVFLQPGCLLDVATSETLIDTELAWFLTPSFQEERGGQSVSLSRQVGLPTFDDPVFDSASCAGRFAGNDLVLLTNGSNASGGYFLPAAFKGEGVIVSTGGFVGEPMAMGRARGGATQSAYWGPVANLIEQLSSNVITFEHEILSFTRPVGSRMEMLGAYRKDQQTLHIEAPVEADLHVDVWASFPGSEAFVYESVLRAVDERLR